MSPHTGPAFPLGPFPLISPSYWALIRTWCSSTPSEKPAAFLAEASFLPSFPSCHFLQQKNRAPARPSALALGSMHCSLSRATLAGKPLPFEVPSILPLHSGDGQPERRQGRRGRPPAKPRARDRLGWVPLPREKKRPVLRRRKSQHDAQTQRVSREKNALLGGDA